MELKNILSEVSQAQKAKYHTSSPSYVDYRPKRNAVILLDMGHTLRRESSRENREREGNIKFECC
jgi:hypothetical protein